MIFTTLSPLGTWVASTKATAPGCVMMGFVEPLSSRLKAIPGVIEVWVPPSRAVR